MARWRCTECGGRTFIVLMLWVPALVSDRREILEWEPKMSAPCLDAEVAECAQQGPGVQCATCFAYLASVEPCLATIEQPSRFWAGRPGRVDVSRCNRKQCHRGAHAVITQGRRTVQWCEPRAARTEKQGGV